MPTENRSSNKEMVSVPREAVVQAAELLQEYNKCSIARDLRAILAQPAVQHQGEPVAVVNEADDGLFVELIYGEDGNPLRMGDKLYARPGSSTVFLLREIARELRNPNQFGWEDALAAKIESALKAHADPGEVERLRIALGNTQALLDQANHHKAQRGETIDTLRADVETMRRKNNEYWHETEVLRAHPGEAEAGCMRLRAQLAERDALLTRALPYLSNTPDLVQHGAEDLAEEIRSASAGRPCYGPNEWGTECGKCSKCKSASAEPSAPVDIDERAKFEAEWRKRYPDHPPLALKRSGLDLADYCNTRTKDAWWAWQARAALERKP